MCSSDLVETTSGRNSGSDREEILRIRSDSLDWVDVDHEVVVLDVEGSTYLAANESGSVMWRLLAEGTTLADLITALVDGYGIEAERAASDVGRFIGELDAQNLLERQ